MGWLSDSLFGKRKKLEIDKIQDYMQPTQDLVNEQLGIGRDMMDPNSEMNQGMLGLMQSNARQAGGQAAMSSRQLAAQTGMSSGQAQMHQRMAMTQANRGVDDSMQQYLATQQQTGLGVLGGMTQMQQGLNENAAQAYVSQVNAHNAARQSRVGMLTGLAGAAIGNIGNFGGKDK